MQRYLQVGCTLLLAAALPVHSGESLRPGEYITENGWGTLTIEKKGAKTTFAIESFGGNFHTCGLSGEIIDQQARLEAMEKTCVITFKPKGTDIQVEPSGSECQYYCGARASFEGTYVKPPAGCEHRARAKTREQFKKLYDEKEYDQAYKKLDGLFQTCSTILGWVETGRIRNDLAITQHKLRDFAGCKATLKPFAEDLALSEDGLRGKYPPSDADVWLPVVKAARFNLKLCEKGRPAK